MAGVTHAKACFEPASSVSRIITPALAQPFVFSTLSTLAIIEPEPGAQPIASVRVVMTNQRDEVMASGEAELRLPTEKLPTQ